MFLTKNEQVIQTLAAHGTDEAFTHDIGFGRTNGCPHDLD
jgi:hypothetical protein